MDNEPHPPSETQPSRGVPSPVSPAPAQRPEHWLHRAVTVLVTALALASLVLVVWFGAKIGLAVLANRAHSSAQAAALETPSVQPTPFDLPVYNLAGLDLSGIFRHADLHTILPSRPRFDVITYTVAKGDTVFGIAEKYGLKPDTILWGNYYTLGGNIDIITPGMQLNILPVDGLYHKWSAGEGLNGVASFYHVTADDIINWPGNHLSADTIGDYADPNIAPGTMLVIPGGWRSLDSVGVQTVTRSNPSAAKYLGSGYCANAVDGVIGNGDFIWPTIAPHYISGYTFSSVHPGIDIGGSLGNPIYAADNGVVIYAGWTDLGYGNIIVLDHGNGWSTYYAHLSEIYVSCGQGVMQGATIGAMGSTGNSSGPHLHFEMHSTKYGKVNPSDFIQ